MKQSMLTGSLVILIGYLSIIGVMSCTMEIKGSLQETVADGSSQGSTLEEERADDKSPEDFQTEESHTENINTEHTNTEEPHTDNIISPDTRSIRCGARSRRYRGPLCGTDNKPCKILRSEIVASTGKGFTSAPSLALDAQQRPHITYNHNHGGYHGFHSFRTGANQWKTSKWSQPAAHLEIASNTKGQLSAVTYNGSYRHSLWRFEQEKWKVLHQWKGSYGGKPQTLDSDDVGCLHFTYKHKDKAELIYARYQKGKWGQKSWSNLGFTQGANIRLSPKGTPHIALWSRDAMQRKGGLFWTNASQKPAIVQPEAAGGSRAQMVLLEVTGEKNGIETPHILFNHLPNFRQKAVKGHLTYLSRENGQWKRLTLETNAHQPCREPQAENETCQYDYTNHTPLAIVHGGTKETLRILYTKHHYSGNLTAKCTGDPFPVPPPPHRCEWTGERKLNSTFIIARIEAGAIKKTTVQTDLKGLGRADAQLDDKGNIHMVFHAIKPGSTKTNYPQVIYWMLGAK